MIEETNTTSAEQQQQGLEDLKEVMMAPEETSLEILSQSSCSKDLREMSTAESAAFLRMRVTVKKSMRIIMETSPSVVPCSLP